MSRFNLVGLDGANSLGFLAAIGTLRTASARWSECPVKMAWSRSTGGWRPYLEIGDTLSEDTFIEGLHSELQKMKGHPAFGFADNLSISAEEFREAALEAHCSSPGRVFHDFIAAFGSEAISDDKSISDTALRTMAGAGHQHFLGSMRQLVTETNDKDLRTALMKDWQYQDDKPSMRWDPNDDRRYALQWKAPTGDPIKTVRGANRLAIEGLPLLPTMPVDRQLETTGFTQKRGKGVVWTWPIWEPAVSVDVLRSLLALNELQEEEPDRQLLTARGVVDVFRCRRIIVADKYRNFTPATPV